MTRPFGINTPSTGVEARFLPSCFMPASRFVVSVFASTDAEIFFPASAKPG